MESYDAPPEVMDAGTEEFALGDQGGPLPPPPPQAPWLQHPPPRKRPFNWPKGGKSPTWVTRMARCPKQHAERYRRKRPDPTGFDGVVGNVIHGALEDAVNIRLSRRGQRHGVPTTVQPAELLYLIELQKNAIRQDTDIVEGDAAWAIVTTEVLAKAREIVSALPPVPLDNVWVSPQGLAGAEYIWSFYATPQLLLAGIADLVQARFPADNTADPHAPSEVVITDWKTGGGQLPTEADLRLDAQAQFQLAWARRQFPRTPRIRFRLWNLLHNKRVEIEWSQGLDELSMSFARACWHLWQAKDESAVVGSHCAHCAYRSDCKPFARYMEQAALKPEWHLENASVEELMRRHYQASILYKLAEGLKKDTAQQIKRALGYRRSHKAGLYESRKRTRKTTSFRDAASLITRLADRTGTPVESLINAMCGIKGDELRGWVRTLPLAKQADAKAAIEAHTLVGETRPWIETKPQELPF